MRPHVPVDVVWDGTRVYRVPSPGEIEAVLLMADGLDTPAASVRLGLTHPDGARRRTNEAQVKLRTTSPAGLLYHLYRLQIVDNPRDLGLDPVLDDRQCRILTSLVHLGLPYEQAHRVFGIGHTTLVRRMAEIKRALRASNRVQALRRAVEHGDIEVETPPELWRGRV